MSDKSSYKQVRIKEKDNAAPGEGIRAVGMRRPECYCLSRHVLTAPSFSTRGIIICISRTSRL